MGVVCSEGFAQRVSLSHRNVGSARPRRRKNETLPFQRPPGIGILANSEHFQGRATELSLELKAFPAHLLVLPLSGVTGGSSASCEERWFLLFFFSLYALFQLDFPCTVEIGTFFGALSILPPSLPSLLPRSGVLAHNRRTKVAQKAQHVAPAATHTHTHTTSGGGEGHISCCALQLCVCVLVAVCAHW